MGPNACGKSIITQGVIKNILLAQALDITPAQKATITPFWFLYCFKEPQDDPRFKNRSL